MTRTSKIGSALSCGAICLSLLVFQPVAAQQSAEASDEATQGKAKVDQAPLPLLDLSSLPSFKELRRAASPSNSKMLLVTPEVNISEEDEEFQFGLFQNDDDCKHGKDCQRCWTAIPMPQSETAGSDLAPQAGSYDTGSSGCPLGDECNGTCEFGVNRAIALEDVWPEAELATAFVSEGQPLQSITDQHCEDLADTLASSLADPDIHPESRRAILATTMKLLVRNAELEACAEVAMLKLQQERELAELRGEMAQLRSYATQMGEVKNWMGPLYTNQTQTQQQFQNLTTNLQLINRTLRLLEQERQAQQTQQPQQVQQPQRDRQLELTQPQQRETNPYVRPDRWSRLPSYEPQNRTRRPDHSTMNQRAPDRSTFRASTSVQSPPRRMTPSEVQQERLQSEIRRMQAQLNQLESDSKIHQASWNEPLPSNPLKPLPQMLRPLPATR